jgi:hypothetical protein
MTTDMSAVIIETGGEEGKADRLVNNQSTTQ